MVQELQQSEREKVAKIGNLAAQNQSLEIKLEDVKGNQEEIIEQMTVLNNQLKDERKKSASLEQELKSRNSAVENAKQVLIIFI